jgi:hypothetical protein
MTSTAAPRATGERQARALTGTLLLLALVVAVVLGTFSLHSPRQEPSRAPSGGDLPARRQASLR